MSLSFVDPPTAETVALLEDLKHQPQHGTQARYGLGTCADHLQKTEPGRAGTIVAGLAKDLQSSQDPKDKAAYLRALGNSGHPDALAAIQPYLTDPNPGVRAAAADALRAIPNPLADQDLALVLKRDTSPDVRRTSLEAMSKRSTAPVTVYAVRDNLKSEPDARVRRPAVNTAIGWKSVAPVLRESLEIVAKNDADPGIRDLASRGL
jgi:HEAT repeat protein